MVRSTFQLTKASVVVTTPERLGLDDVIVIGNELIKECRQAARLGIDVSTLERVLNDQHNARA